MPGYRDLIVWQKAMELVTDIYGVTSRFPRSELFGLTSQLRRAAVSVASNIAEGDSRNSKNELHQFVGTARGSLAEVETQLQIAGNLGYLDPLTSQQLLEKAARIGRLLSGLRAWSKGAGK